MYITSRTCKTKVRTYDLQELVVHIMLIGSGFMRRWSRVPTNTIEVIEVDLHELVVHIMFSR